MIGARDAGIEKWNDRDKPSNWRFPLRKPAGSFPHSLLSNSKILGFTTYPTAECLSIRSILLALFVGKLATCVFSSTSKGFVSNEKGGPLFGLHPAALQHFFSRDTLGIAGLLEPNILSAFQPWT